MTVESTAPQIFVAGGGLTDFGIWHAEALEVEFIDD